MITKTTRLIKKKKKCLVIIRDNMFDQDASSLLADRIQRNIYLYHLCVFMCVTLCVQISFIVSNVSSRKTIWKVMTVLFFIILPRPGSTVTTAVQPLWMSHFFVHREP